MKNQFTNNFKKGYSLIEMILYITISTVVLMVLMFFFLMILDSRTKTKTIAEVELQGVQILNSISQAVREAESINSPEEGESDSRILLEYIIQEKNPTVISASGTTLYMRQNNEEFIDLHSSRVEVSNLDFYNLSREGTPGIVQVEFTLTHVNPADDFKFDYSKTYSTSFSIR